MDLKKRYQITDNNIAEYSGKAENAFERSNSKINFILSCFLILLMPFLISGLLTSLFFDREFNSLELRSFLIVIILIIIKVIAKFYNYKPYKNFFIIKQIIYNFNSSVEEIEALLNNKEARDKLPRCEDILELLDLVKSDLICNLKLEKVYRENPNYKGGRKIKSDMSSDQEFLQVINNIYTQSKEMNDFFNRLTEIRQSVKDVHNI